MFGGGVGRPTLVMCSEAGPGVRLRCASDGDSTIRPKSTVHAGDGGCCGRFLVESGEGRPHLLQIGRALGFGDGGSQIGHFTDSG